MQAAPKPNLPPKAPLTRAQKLRWYAEQLMADAATDEKAGSIEMALTHYLEAAEILLLLAKVEQNYTAWKYYADNASLCQQKARKLIALTPKDQPASGTPTSTPDATPRS
jgi:hypothetical protein